MADGPTKVLGRYALHGEIASGGMATVHLGRLLGPIGFSRTVAIKRLHPQYAKDPDFVAMFLDEARVASRIQHPNVVQTLDVVALEGELFLVMDYVEGESLARLIRIARAGGERIPPKIVGAIMSQALYGLHAAHEATTERGEPLQIIHRDVSPQNILVGVDGISRVLDFGVAKAAGRMQTTREGQIKGKLAYMPPEQILAEVELDRRVDIYAAGVCLWEALVGKRLFDGENEGAILHKIIAAEIPPPSHFAPDLPPGVDAVVLRALSRDRDARFDTAWQMAVAIEETLGAEIPRRVGAFVEGRAHETIADRSSRVRQLESLSTQIDGLMTTHDSAPDAALPTAPRSKKKPDRRALVLVLTVFIAVVLIASLALAFMKGRDPSGAASTRAADPSGGALSTSTSAAKSASGAGAGSGATTLEPTASATAPLSVSVNISAIVPVTSTKPTGTPPKPTGTVTAPPIKTSAPSGNCNPPYTLQGGRRVLKPECIK